MAKPEFLLLNDKFRIPILYQDRTVIALDKPALWVVGPERVAGARNLQTLIEAGIRTRQAWARLHALRFLRYVHRLDAETTGVILFVKNAGAINAFSRLFEERAIAKTYLAVVPGSVSAREWTCRLKLGEDRQKRGRIVVDEAGGREAETHFRVIASQSGRTLIEATPVTGRTHQIRVHLAETAAPVIGDSLYGRFAREQRSLLALRSVYLGYRDPFQHRDVRIVAPTAEFLERFGFNAPTWQPSSGAHS